MSNDKQSNEEQTQGYICPVTKVQCDDECCVSAEDCHIKSWDGIVSSNDKQIPTALEFLHRDESGVFNEVDIVQAMDGYAKLHVERIKQFLYEEICERRPYSSSKMCEEVLKFIEQMDNN